MGSEGGGAPIIPPSVAVEINTDPSMATASDEAIIKYLAEEKKLYESWLGPQDSVEVNAHLSGTDPSELPGSFLLSRQSYSSFVEEREQVSKSRPTDWESWVLEVYAHFSGTDPSELPGCFILPRPSFSSFVEETMDGEWMNELWNTSWKASELEEERKKNAWRCSWDPVPDLHTAIRGTTGTDDGRYVGTKQVRQLCVKDGTKMDKKTGLFMTTYSLLSTTPTSDNNAKKKKKNKYDDDDRSDVLYLDDDLVFCKVFQLKRPSGQLPDQASSSCSSCLSEEQPTKKCRVSSKAWEKFTKIKTNDGELVYAVCHRCDKIFNARSKKDGTSHLLGHSKTCAMRSLLQSSGDPTWTEIAKCSDKDLKYYEALLLGN